MENARQKELMREAQRAKEILEKNGQPNLRLPSVVIP